MDVGGARPNTTIPAGAFVVKEFCDSLARRLNGLLYMCGLSSLFVLKGRKSTAQDCSQPMSTDLVPLSPASHYGDDNSSKVC